MTNFVSRLHLIAIAMSLATACGGSSTTGSGSGSDGSGNEGESASAGGSSSDGSAAGGGAAGDDEFQLSDSQTADQAHGDHPSEIEASATHAAMRLFVVDPNTGPIEGIVIKMTGPDGTAYYTHETDTQGYAEVLVPVGQRYGIEYLSLGRQTTTANVQVAEGPNQDIRLTMRYRRRQRVRRPVAPPPQRPDEPAPEPAPEPGIVLEGVLFESGLATIQEESYPRIDRVVEYLTHRASARIRIAGHTDNVGNPQRNQTLSEERAQAVADYIVAHGIESGRVEAVGFGDQLPVASNDTDEGRHQNRRIEALEL